MKKIKHTQESIQNSLLNSDIGCLGRGRQITSMTVSQYDSIPVKKQASKKKMTFYLTKESETKLNQVFSRKLMNDEKVDKSILINEAIELLWRENGK